MRRLLEIASTNGLLLAVALAAAATPAAADDPVLPTCTVSGVQSAEPARLEIHQTTELRLHLFADCPEQALGRADILLLLDHSGSMGQLGKSAAADAAIRQFVANVDFDQHRVGLVVFNASAYIAQVLTDQPDHVLRALTSIGVPGGGTHIAGAIDMAREEMGFALRPATVGAIVMLTDGISDEAAMLRAAAEAEDDGIVIFAIGLGGDTDVAALTRAASTPSHFYLAPGPDQLAAIYDRVADLIRGFTLSDVTFSERLGPYVEYLPGSARPLPPLSIDNLEWWQPLLPRDGLTVTYRVRVERAGRFAPSTGPWADYTDADGLRKRFDFAPAMLDVFVPDTRSVYLPVAWRNQCLPAESWSDIVLAIDASASMTGTKIEQAVLAAKQFVGLLDLRTDQAAVVRYDHAAQLVQPLTRDRAALESALDGLIIGSGTRIDQGIARALDELVGPRRAPGSRPVMVLLSDGRQVEAAGRALTEAALARAAGVDLFTIALGADADQELLRSVAGDPSRAYFAPDAADLAEIYGRIAGAVRCR